MKNVNKNYVSEKIMTCRRGEIYYVDFGSDYNSAKTQGVRPAIIVSNNKANTYSPAVTVVPLTSRVWKKRYLPTNVYIPSKKNGMTRPSLALVGQVETLDKKCLERKLGEVSDKLIMERLTKALQIQIGAYSEYN